LGRFSCWRPIPKADFFTANSVLAPVVVDAKTPEGVHAFPSYVDTLSRHNNAEIAEVEARGCKPYFSSMRRIRDRSPSKAAARTNKLGEKMPDGSMYLGQSSAEACTRKILPPTGIGRPHRRAKLGLCTRGEPRDLVRKEDQEELISPRPTALPATRDWRLPLYQERPCQERRKDRQPGFRVQER